MLTTLSTWRGGRVVEGTGLENRQRRESLVGSNPTPSASESYICYIISKIAEECHTRGAVRD
jgi:hypothetical protein